jgi:hypothetical protein
MKSMLSLSVICTLLLVTASSFAGLYGDAPNETHAWQVHDMRRERPAVVAPGKQVGDAPADAIVLFDGSDLSKWEADKQEKGVTSKWRIVNGVLESVRGAGYIRTKESFGDCQLHVEWSTPIKVQGNSQGRGNSGVFLMGLYEVQVLDCFNNDTYPDGQAGSVYGQYPPLVNVCRGPGEWQTYDIVFRQPRLKDGKLVRPGYLTVMQNGVLVQDHWVLEGPTGHRGRTKLRAHAEKQPFKIQDHGNPVRFRNIWIRELPERSDGGLNGPYTDPKVVAAKRVETAAKIRQEASDTSDRMQRVQLLMESLAYEKETDTANRVERMLTRFLGSFKEADQEKVESRKGQIMALRGSIKYLVQNKIVPGDYAPMVAIEALVKKYKLDEKK